MKSNRPIFEGSDLNSYLAARYRRLKRRRRLRRLFRALGRLARGNPAAIENGNPRKTDFMRDRQDRP